MKTPFVTEYKPYGFLIEMWVVVALLIALYIWVFYENYTFLKRTRHEHDDKKKN